MSHAVCHLLLVVFCANFLLCLYALVQPKKEHNRIKKLLHCKLLCPTHVPMCAFHFAGTQKEVLGLVKSATPATRLLVPNIGRWKAKGEDAPSWDLLATAPVWKSETCRECVAFRAGMVEPTLQPALPMPGATSTLKGGFLPGEAPGAVQKRYQCFQAQVGPSAWAPVPAGVPPHRCFTSQIIQVTMLDIAPLAMELLLLGVPSLLWAEEREVGILRAMLAKLKAGFSELCSLEVRTYRRPYHPPEFSRQSMVEGLLVVCGNPKCFKGRVCFLSIRLFIIH